MKLFDNILVPIDFSDTSVSALKFAIQIAEKTAARLTLVYAMRLIPPANGTSLHIIPGKLKSDLEAKVQRQFEDIERDLLEYSSVSYEFTVKIGFFIDVIISMAEANQFDLIVMGTNGNSGPNKYFGSTIATGLGIILTGSNVEKMVRFSTCPVITVSNEFNLNSIRNIVFATDLGESHDGVVQSLKNFQQLTNSKLHLVWINTVHVMENEEVMKERLEEFASLNNLENYTVNVFKSITPDSGIMYFAEEKDADMIAIGTHGRKGLSRIFLGSLAEDIVNHADRPVWTLSYKSIKT